MTTNDTSNTTSTDKAPKADAFSSMKVSTLDSKTSISAKGDISEGRTGILATARRGAFAATGKLEGSDLVDITMPSGRLMRGVPLREVAKLGMVVEDATRGFVEVGAPAESSEVPPKSNAKSDVSTDAQADLPADHPEHWANRAESFATADGKAALDYLAQSTGDILSAAAVFMGNRSVPDGVDRAAVELAEKEVEGIMAAAVIETGVPSAQLQDFWDDLSAKPQGKQKVVHAALKVLASGDLRPVRALAREFMASRNVASAKDLVNLKLPSGKVFPATAATVTRLRIK